jgi:hypothetical protein
MQRPTEGPEEGTPLIWCEACQCFYNMPMPGERKLDRETKESRTENGQESEQVSYERSRTDGA